MKFMKSNRWMSRTDVLYNFDKIPPLIVLVEYTHFPFYTIWIQLEIAEIVMASQT